MIIQILKLRTPLSETEITAIARERVPEYRAVPGLLQKYYLKLDGGQFGAVYIWDSPESLNTFRESELAATIASSYRVSEPPQIEFGDVLFQLRD